MSSFPEFIPAAGASLATLNVIEGRAPIRWLERKSSKDPVDNGWRVMSAADNSEYLSNGDNWRIVDYNELCAIEPALIGVWNLPVGTELRLVVDPEGKKTFLDDRTGEPIPLSTFR